MIYFSSDSKLCSLNVNEPTIVSVIHVFESKIVAVSINPITDDIASLLDTQKVIIHASGAVFELPCEKIDAICHVKNQCLGLYCNAENKLVIWNYESQIQIYSFYCSLPEPILIFCEDSDQFFVLSKRKQKLIIFNFDENENIISSVQFRLTGLPKMTNVVFHLNTIPGLPATKGNSKFEVICALKNRLVSYSVETEKSKTIDFMFKETQSEDKSSQNSVIKVNPGFTRVPYTQDLISSFVSRVDIDQVPRDMEVLDFHNVPDIQSENSSLKEKIEPFSFVDFSSNFERFSNSQNQPVKPKIFQPEEEFKTKLEKEQSQIREKNQEMIVNFEEKRPHINELRKESNGEIHLNLEDASLINISDTDSKQEDVNESIRVDEIQRSYQQYKQKIQEITSEDNIKSILSKYILQTIPNLLENHLEQIINQVIAEINPIVAEMVKNQIADLRMYADETVIEILEDQMEHEMRLKSIERHLNEKYLEKQTQMQEKIKPIVPNWEHEYNKKNYNKALTHLLNTRDLKLIRTKLMTWSLDVLNTQLSYDVYFDLIFMLIEIKKAGNNDCDAWLEKLCQVIPLKQSPKKSQLFRILLENHSLFEQFQEIIHNRLL